MFSFLFLLLSSLCFSPVVLSIEGVYRAWIVRDTFIFLHEQLSINGVVGIRLRSLGLHTDGRNLFSWEGSVHLVEELSILIHRIDCISGLSCLEYWRGLGLSPWTRLLQGALCLLSLSYQVQLIFLLSLEKLIFRLRISGAETSRFHVHSWVIQNASIELIVWRSISVRRVTLSLFLVKCSSAILLTFAI